MSTPKPEAVDFYVGNKADIKYLGTLFVPFGSPEHLKALTRFSNEGMAGFFEEAQFRAALAELAAGWGGFEDPYGWVDSWPHPYEKSIETPWTYRYDHSAVHVYQSGYLVETILCNGSREPYPHFPTMPVGSAELSARPA